MAKKTKKADVKCKSCTAKRVVNGICNACGVVQDEDAKSKTNGTD